MKQPLLDRKKDLLLTGLVAIIALLPRLIGLSRFLTADEPKSWFGRSIQFLDALARADFIATFDSPAPGVTTMWAGAIGLLLDYARQGFPGSLTAFLAATPFDPLNPAILPLIRIPVVLVAVLAAILTYLWGKAIMGRPAALLTALLLALDPFLLALTRILGHDGLVTLFMWLSLLSIINYQLSIINYQKFTIHNSQFIIISGVLGGLAFLTKYPSLFLGAFVAITLLIYHWRYRQSWEQMTKRWVLDVALWSLAAGVVFVLLWPAMWVDPVGRVLAIINDALRASGSPHQKGSFFFGQPVADPGVSFYLIVTMFKTTPVIWLGWLLLLIGFVLDWRRGQLKRPWWQVALTIFSFSMLYGLLVTVGGKKQDRYILPAFPGFTALAAMGYVQLTINNEKLTKRFPRLAASSNSQSPNLSISQSPITNYQLLITAVIVLIQTAFVLPTAPYFFSYYNPVLGGGNAAAEKIIVGWGEGLDNAAEWLNAQPNAEELDIVAWYSTTFEPYFKGNAIYKIEDEKISRTPKPGLAADYVVLYVNQLQRQLPTSGALQHFMAVPPAHTVTINGTDYAWIYPSIAMQHVIAEEARLVGQAELLGFNLVGAEGQRLDTPATDQTVTVELYWEWQGKQPAEIIGLSLVDDAEQAWGWGNPLGTQARLPFEQWQEGMVAHDNFGLAIFPGTPPGDYFLRVWIDRPATGERVGDFPITIDMRVTLTRPTTPPSPDDLPLTTRLNAPLMGEAITLLGLETGTGLDDIRQPGDTLDLNLYWQSNKAIEQNLPLTLHLVEVDSNVIRAEWQDQPAYPTGQWQPGDITRDPWALTLPAHVPPDVYQLTAQLGNESPVNLLAVQIGGRPRQFSTPPINLPIDAQFGPAITLLGVQGALANNEIEATPGQPLQFNLVWQANNLIDADYTVTAQLLAGQQVIAQQDKTPLGGTAPTTSWAQDEVIIDPFTLTVPPDADGGQYQLLLALYHFETGERLLLPNGADHLTIPVRIQE